jgi:hypothetical protein
VEALLGFTKCVLESHVNLTFRLTATTKMSTVTTFLKAAGIGLVVGGGGYYALPISAAYFRWDFRNPTANPKALAVIAGAGAVGFYFWGFPGALGAAGGVAAGPWLVLIAMFGGGI